MRMGKSFLKGNDMKLNMIGGSSQGDPYVIASKGKYYMYVTGRDGVGLYVSSDLKTFEYRGICFSKEGEKEYWAPSVIELDGTYYMYLSYMGNEENDTHKEHLILATSVSPEGPFVYHNDLVEPFSIDAHVVQSGKGLYLFYSTNDYEAKRAGTLIKLIKLKNPFETEGEGKVVVRATLDEEIFMKDRFKKGQHWHTLEGAFYFRKGDYHYLMYSGNCYQNENYYIGYAVAKGNTDDLLELSFHKYPNEDTYCPLIKKNELESGTGHNSLLVKDGHYYVIYHGRDNNAQGKGDTRTARIAEIKADEGRLEVIGR